MNSLLFHLSKDNAMTQSPLALVTGANGHLGNNLVRHLLQNGVNTRASVRNLSNITPFHGLDCEVVQADITNKASLLRAMNGVQTLYAVGASFKLWAKNEHKEIYDVNMNGTRNTLEAASEAGVQKIVYVSSIAALNHRQTPICEANGFNPDRCNVYYNSKNDSELLAFELAQKYGIELVSVLPSAMIGGENFGLNESYRLLATIYQKKVPIETSIYLNWVDVKDVAAACYQAALNGRNGERYTLANAKGMSIRETTELIQSLSPVLGLKLPIKTPRWTLWTLAWFMETVGKLTQSAPLMKTSDIEMFYGVRQDFDIRKAIQDLDFRPASPQEAVANALEYLRSHPHLLPA